MAKVNDACIACGVCVNIAPEIFEINNENWKSHAIKQPETPEEQKKFEDAKASCPTSAIED